MILAWLVNDLDLFIGLQKEIADLHIKISALQASGGETILQLDKELQQLKDENTCLKAEVVRLQQEINVERDKLTALEGTLANLTSGQEDMIARERAAAEERAEKSRQREIEFANEIKALETKTKNIELKLKSDLKQTKNEAAKLEKLCKDEFDQMKKVKDLEIEDLRRYHFPEYLIIRVMFVVYELLGSQRTEKLSSLKK